MNHSFVRTFTVFAPNHRELIPSINSLCVGDVSPTGLGRFGRRKRRRRNTLVLPRHEHVRGQLNVLVVLGQGEEGVAAGVALGQGQSQVSVLCLKRTKRALM